MCEKFNSIGVHIWHVYPRSRSGSHSKWEDDSSFRNCSLSLSVGHTLCAQWVACSAFRLGLCVSSYLVPQICPPIYLLVCPPSANPSCIHLHPIHSSINRWLSICCACAQVYTFSYTHTLDLFSGRNVKYERKWIKRGDWKKRWME